MSSHLLWHCYTFNQCLFTLPLLVLIGFADSHIGSSPKSSELSTSFSRRRVEGGISLTTVCNPRNHTHKFNKTHTHDHLGKLKSFTKGRAFNCGQKRLLQHNKYQLLFSRPMLSKCYCSIANRSRERVCHGNDLVKKRVQYNNMPKQRIVWGVATRVMKETHTCTEL